MSVDQPDPQSARTVHADLAIDAENVHVTYADGTAAVRGVDLAVERGEFFGFLGSNGAGKTTTVRTLVTLLSPTRGTVRINGYDVADDAQAVRESIGYMAQETSIDLELTPRENLRIACEMYGVPRDQRADRIDHLLDLVDLQDVADRRAETFSGGMQKRLDTATVLVHRPPVVFLDEPTTGLDPRASRTVIELISEQVEAGTTVFLSSHILPVVEELADTVGVLYRGELVAEASPERLVERTERATGADTLEEAFLEVTTDRESV
jgi:ABC-2 type transport system ATP-binding protein